MMTEMDGNSFTVVQTTIFEAGDFTVRMRTDIILYELYR